MRLVAAMNENGLPISNITNITRPAKSSALNGVQNNDVSFSHLQCIIPQENERSIINNTSMSSGGILYPPIVVQQQNGFTGTDVLRQIIANDVHSPKNLKTTNVNSRNMVIKTAPHGAVQITYRKMIHSLPEYKKPIHILPKPTSTNNPSKSVNHPAYLISSNATNTNDTMPLQTPSPKSMNSLDNYRGNYLLSTSQSTSPSSISTSKCSNNTDFTETVINSSHDIQDSHITNSTNSHTHTQIIGSSKNLNISLPKIKKPPLMPSLQLQSNGVKCEKSLYTSTFNGECSMEHVNDHFDSNYEMEDVSNFISSSNDDNNNNNNDNNNNNNNTNLTNGHLNHLNDLDMDLLSMDIDSLDAITMTTFLQNGTLFSSDHPNDYSLSESNGVGNTHKVTSSSSSIVSSDLIPDFSVNTIDSTITSLANVQPEVPCTNSTETFKCNQLGETSFKMKTNQELADKVYTNGINFNKQLSIIDVSPETSTTLGGCKIILIGSWNAKDARYFCKFGNQMVNAELIQNGVLRCYSPKHAAGKVKLCVLCDNEVSSNEVDFLIVNPSDTSEDKSIKHNSWMSITNRSLVLLLIERITAIAEIIGVEGISNLKEISIGVKSTDTEELKQCQERLVGICKKLMTEKVNFAFDYNVENTMTVLHLAAALGFTKFIQLLLKWVETNPNKLIMVEACPTQYDQFSLLPIMWSSAKGHFNTTCVLHQWVENTIEEFDACGCTAIDLAKECGHETIAEYLERLQKKSNASKENTSQAEEADITASLSSAENQHQSLPGTSEQAQNNNDCSPRTLGKTLARIQSMISDQDDVSNLHELNLNGEESLFETSPFTPRQRPIQDENDVSLNAHSRQHSPSSPSQAPQSPFNRQAFQTAEFCEFFYKAKKIEKDFAELTLTDEEQQDLLRAANVIQSAYKTYKERRKRRDQEFIAAVLIQSYYRRYKQYAAFKKMQKGAVVIQNQYRAHREKSKKKVKAATTIQAYYRRYRERKNGGQDVQAKNKLQQQADRKVNRYLKQTSSRFSREFPDSLLNDDTSSASTSPEPS